MARRAQPKPQIARQLLSIGQLNLVRLDDGALWLTHRDGEGMQCNPATEKKLARTLERFFRKHF